MKKRRAWEPKAKAGIVLQGIKGTLVTDICVEHGITQTQYYQWRDQFLTNAARAFESAKDAGKEERLKKENEKLKGMIGELTLELKKSDLFE